jgi:hypothetical protein
LGTNLTFNLKTVKNKKAIFSALMPKLLNSLKVFCSHPAKTVIFSLSKPMARNSPTFANLTKVSFPEKFSLKTKKNKVWLTK